MSARLKFRGWKLYATAVASFACGSIITAHLTHIQEVKADSNRVFELMVYHTEPGKVPSLESIFKDASKLQAKTRAQHHRLLGAERRLARLERHICLPYRSFQSG
jgi:hypothetical protein